MSGVILECQHTDPIKVYAPAPTIIKEKNEPEEEFKKLETLVKKKNDEISTEYNLLVEKLEALGCNTDDLEGPEYIGLPEECFLKKKNDVIKYNGISVCCHCGTAFYKSLLNMGFLRKYAPKDY